MAQQKAYTLKHVRTQLEQAVKDVGSARAFGKLAGVSGQAVWNILNDQARRPGEKILKELGYEEVTVYLKTKTQKH